MRTIILALIIIITAMPVTCKAAEDASISAETDRTAIARDDILELTVTVSGNTNSAPELPSMGDFEIISQSIYVNTNIVNFKYSKKTIYSYILKPLKEGKLTIGPVKLTENGSILQTQPITVTVDDRESSGIIRVPKNTIRTAPRQNMRILPFFDENKDDVIVENSVSSKTAYVNQQIVFEIDLLSDPQSYSQTKILPPSSKNFLTEQIKPEEFSAVEKNGSIMNSQKTKFVLYPLKEGELTIEPFTIAYSTHFRGIQKKVTDTANILVKNLPENKPEDFCNGIGDFSLSAATEQASAEVGKPINLVITAEGYGNASAINIPFHDIDGLQKFNSAEAVSKETDEKKVKEKKVTTVTLVPQKAGEQEIPAITASFFNPETEKYYQLKTEPIKLEVLQTSTEKAPAKADTAISGIRKQYRGIKDSFTRQSTMPVYKNPFAIALTLIPVIIYLIFSVRAFILRKNQQKKISKKNINILKQLKKNLANVKNKNNPELAYSAIYNNLFDFLVKKLALPPSVTVKEIIEQLTQYNVKQEILADIKALFDKCDEARFTSCGPDKCSDEILEQCINIAKGLEAAIKKGEIK